MSEEHADILAEQIRIASFALPERGKMLPARFQGRSSDLDGYIAHCPDAGRDWAIRHAPASFFTARRLRDCIHRAAEQESLRLLMGKLRGKRDRRTGMWPSWVVSAFCETLQDSPAAEQQATILQTMMLEGIPIPEDDARPLAEVARALLMAAKDPDSAVRALATLMETATPLPCLEVVYSGVANGGVVPSFLDNFILALGAERPEALPVRTETNVFESHSPANVIASIWHGSDILSPSARRVFARMMLKLIDQMEQLDRTRGALITAEAKILAGGGTNLDDCRQEIETYLETGNASEPL